MSITKAAKQYSIAKGTLVNKLKDKHGGRVGRPVVFTETEESSMVHHMLAVAEWGFPFDKDDLRYLAKMYLDKCDRTVTQFGSQNLPSKEWAWRFLQRHKGELSNRTCQNLKKAKAAVPPEEITEYFNQLQHTLLEENAEGDMVNIPAERIYNYDETNLADDPGVKRCIFKRGIKYAERIKDSSKASISLMYCGSAAGVLLPPYVVYKSTHLWQSWMEGGPPLTRYNRSLSGWFDSVVFTDWFKNLFLPHTRKLNGKVILIGDNLSSHFTKEVIALAEENDVTFVCIPPNTTHICQPLDVAFYAPLKRYWRGILDKWKVSQQKRSQSVTKECFPRLLKSLQEKICDEDNVSINIASGFQKCGIFPFRPESVIDRMPKVRIQEEEEGPVVNRVSDVVLNMLKSMRHSPSKQTTKKRKRVNIPPGMGITLEELSVSSSSAITVPTPSTSTSVTHQDKRKRTNRPNRVCSESEVSDDSDNIPYADTSDDIICSTDGSEESSEETVTAVTDIAEKATEDSLIPKNEFVIVKVPIQSKKCNVYHRYYIGQIKDVDREKNTYDIMYMRKKNNIFVWPVVPDLDSIDFEQVELRLHSPDKLKRGFRFSSADIEGYDLL